MNTFHRAVFVFTLVCFSSLAGAQSQPGVGYGNSSLGGFTPQPGTTQPPLGASVTQVQNELERGFSDGTAQVNAQINQAGQQVQGGVRTAVDSLGRVIMQPIDNGRQLVGDIVSGPQALTNTQSNEPARNLLDRTASELQNTGDAFRDSFNRAGQNTREALGLSDPNRAAHNEQLQQPPPGWNGQPTAPLQPNSWGTAADPLASPPPGVTATNVGNSGQNRSVLVTPGAQPADNRPAWGSGQPAATNSTDPHFTAPPLQSVAQQPQQQQPPMQPVLQQPSQQPLYTSLVERGPALGNPAPGLTADGRPLSEVPGSNNPWGDDSWGRTQPTSTVNTWNDQLSQPPPQQLAQQPASTRPGASDSTIPQLRTVGNETPSDPQATQEAIRNLNQPQSSDDSVTNANAASGTFVGFGWICFIGAVVGNLYQWFNILDLRNKYRNALRRGSPSLARTI